MFNLYDSAFRLYLKYQKTRYVPTSEIAPINAQIAARFEKMNSEQGVMTFIAADPISVLAVIPDFTDYQILRMYPYSEKMVAADVSYTLSKGQAAGVKAGLYQQTLARTDKHMEELAISPIGCAFRECAASGYAFAQTYHTSDSPTVQTPPIGDGWCPNKFRGNDGLHQLDEKRSVQVWRMIFTHIGQGKYSNKQVRDAGRFKFGLDLASQVQKSTFEVDQMHCYERHPDYQYASTVPFRSDLAEPPNGYYWQENVTINDDFDAHGSTSWRRPFDTKIRDVEGVWQQPSATVMLLNPETFGKMFGPVLPPGLAGVDFAEGPIAMINWFGNLTYQLRSRDGKLSEELPWTEDKHLPIRKDWMTQAIGNFVTETK